MPSHISDTDGMLGIKGSGSAKAANGVGISRKGCERRWKKGRFRMGCIGPLRAGTSICSSGGIGRIRAMATTGTMSGAIADIKMSRCPSVGVELRDKNISRLVATLR